MFTIPTPAAGDLDVLIGQNLRDFRRMRGLSMQKLAVSLGVTHQQIQKYEQGRNRVSAATLYRLSKILDVRVDAFFPEAVGDEGEAMLTAVHADVREPLMNLIRALPVQDRSRRTS